MRERLGKQRAYVVFAQGAAGTWKRAVGITRGDTKIRAQEAIRARRSKVYRDTAVEESVTSESLN